MSTQAIYFIKIYTTILVRYAKKWYTLKSQWKHHCEHKILQVLKVQKKKEIKWSIKDANKEDSETMCEKVRIVASTYQKMQMCFKLQIKKE